MRSPLIRGALAVLVLGIVIAAAMLLLVRPPELAEVRTASRRGPAPDPVPWREPEADLRRYFPGADAHREEVRILSGARLELADRLRRQPTAEEHGVVLHRVLRQGRPVGVVMVRRVAGTGGSVELVISTSGGKVRGVHLQRHREPAAIARVLDSEEWRGRWLGRTSGSDWADAEPGAPSSGPAGEVTQTVARTVRDALVVLEIAERRGLVAGSEPHH